MIGDLESNYPWRGRKDDNSMTPDRSAPRKPRLLRRGRGELNEIVKIFTGKPRSLGREASITQEKEPFLGLRFHQARALCSCSEPPDRQRP